MLLPSQHRELTETYRLVHLGEVDDITDVMIEEIVEELIEECVEFGCDLDEAADLVENATTEYLMELNPYAPAGSKEARAYQKSTTATKRGEARKAAVKGAVERVKSVGRTAKAVAGVAGSIAKDEARRAGRGAAHAATKAVGAVSAAASKKKAEVKQGVKSLLGRGLRKAAGAAGVVAQKARKAGAAAGRAAERLGEKVEVYDVVLEYLCTEGYAEDFEDAESIMVYLEPGAVEAIAESGWHRRNPEKIGSSEDPDVRMKSPTGGRSSSTPSKPPTAAERKGHRRTLYNYYGQGGKEEAIKRAKAERDAARTKRNNR
jgi:hypothetical protein